MEEATLRSGVGLSSGIDSGSIIDSLTNIRRIPITDLQQKIDLATAQKKAFSTLTSELLTVKLGFSTMKNSFTFNNKSVTNSDDSILDATANSATPAGSYTFQTYRTATSHAIRTNGFADSDSTSVGAGTIELSFGAKDLAAGTDVDLLNNQTGIFRGSINIQDKAGNTAEVDLSRVVTVEDVLDEINNTTGISITASVDSTGERLLLTDTSGGGGNINISEVAGGSTASDLGILGTSAGLTLTGTDIHGMNANTSLSILKDGLGVDLGVVSFTDRTGASTNIDFRTAKTVGDVLDLISNEAGVDLTATIDANGNGITVTDDSGSTASNLIIADVAGYSTATDLGISTNIAANSVSSDRLVGGLNTVLLTSLSGAQETGIDLSGISVTDRAGAGPTNINFAGATTLQDVMDAINNSGANVLASINDKGNGIQIQDTSGSSANPLIIGENGGTSAADLGIFTAGANSSLLSGDDLDLKILSSQTRLDSMNGNMGVNEGTFSIRNTNGLSFDIEIDSSHETLGDVIEEINGAVVGVTASINATGDGIQLLDTAGGGGSLTVSDSSGEVAKSLNLIGSYATVNSTTINGSYDYTITTSAADTLETLEQKLDNINAPITASILSTGSGPNPYRLSINSETTGDGGRLIMTTDISGLDFNDTTVGSDAIVFMGVDGANANPLKIQNYSNKIQNVMPGLSLDLKKTSDDIATISIARDTQNIVDKMTEFVEGVNVILGDLKEALKFQIGEDEDDESAGDEEDPTVTKGILHGNSVARGIQDSLFNLISSTVEGVEGNYTGFYSAGVRLNSQGTLDFDQSRLQEALDTNPDDLERLFTFTANVASQEFGGFVTASSVDPTFNTQNVINGNTDQASFGATNGYQDNTANTFPDTLTFSLGGTRDISKIVLHHLDSATMPLNSFGIKDYTVEYFDQVSNQFKIARTITDNNQSTATINFPEILNTDTFRIKVNDAYGDRTRLVEFEAFENRGLGSQVADTLTGLVDSIDGSILRETSRLDDEIASLEERIDKVEERALSEKLRLQRQFDAMETALSQLQSQSGAFSSLLSGLPG